MAVKVLPWLQNIAILKKLAEQSRMDWMEENKGCEQHHFRSKFAVMIRVHENTVYTDMGCISRVCACPSQRFFFLMCSRRGSIFETCLQVLSNPTRRHGRPWCCVAILVLGRSSRRQSRRPFLTLHDSGTTKVMQVMRSHCLSSTPIPWPWGI